MSDSEQAENRTYAERPSGFYRLFSYWRIIAIGGAIGLVATLPFENTFQPARALLALSIIFLYLGAFFWLCTPGGKALLGRTLDILIYPNPEDNSYIPIVKHIPKRMRRWIITSTTLALIMVAIAIAFDFGPWRLLYVLLCLVLTVLIAWCLLRRREVLLALHLPVLLAIAYFFLLQSDQGIEAIRTINEYSWLARIGTYALWLGCCVMFSDMLLALATLSLRRRKQQDTSIEHRLVLMALGILPFISATYASWWALEQAEAGAVSHRIDWVVLAFWLLSGLFCAIIIGHDIFMHRKPPESGGAADLAAIKGEGPTQSGDPTQPKDSTQPPGAILLGISSAFFLGAALLPTLFRYEMPPALFLPGWMGFTALFFFMIGNGGRFLGLPAVLLLLLWGGLLSAFDLNDNHELSFARRPNLPVTLADQAFSDWLGAAKDDGKPVTAFVVVSEGGGARAAYMTAVALEALRTRCPAFRRHHFATIAVSGGSLGATLSAIAPAPAPDSADAECKTVASFDVSTSKAISTVGIDLLGPVLRGLSLDLLMRFWPSSLWRTDGAGEPDKLNSPWVASFGDRTQYIETSLARNWNDSGFLDRLLRTAELQNRLFSTAWPGPNGDSPALILLTTDVGSGRRVAISHLRFGPPAGENCLSQREASKQPFDERARLLTMAEIAPHRDPTLLGAALTSARFPIITPAATLPCPGVPWRLVDGGYFENSGLTTALDLAEAMARGSVKSRAQQVAEAGSTSANTQPNPVQVVLVRIENSDATPMTNPSPRETSTWFPELFSPLRAFGGTRDARADLARVAVDRAQKRGVYGVGCFGKDGGCVQFKHFQLKLAPCETAIPLGWSLSEGAKTDIRRQLGIESGTNMSACVKNAAKHNLDVFSNIMKLASGSHR